MPWRERIVSHVREEFVRRVLSGEATKTELCKEYGISRPTGDKWITRYLKGDTLEDQSRRPFCTPRETDRRITDLILNYRTAHPAIGAAKIRKILEKQGHEGLPCVKTINNILKRNGLITEKASLAATPIQRFERSTPNEMWQSDYKGHFEMGNQERCHPLNILDDHSRFNICCRALRTETFEEIQPVMIEVFQEFGLPQVFLCDNGNPWGTAQSLGFSKFEVWMMKNKVLVLHGRPRHPQTQGKEERFNQSMKNELLKYTNIKDLEDANQKFQEYRNFYNEERPHHALNLDTPSEHYTKSNRKYQKYIQDWIYPDDCEVRRVKSTGYFNWESQGYFLSEAFGGEEIGVRRSHIEGYINLYFRQFRIGRIDLEKRAYVFKRAYLIEGDPRSKK